MVVSQLELEYQLFPTIPVERSTSSQHASSSAAQPPDMLYRHSKCLFFSGAETDKSQRRPWHAPSASSISARELRVLSPEDVYKRQIILQEFLPPNITAAAKLPLAAT